MTETLPVRPVRWIWDLLLALAVVAALPLSLLAGAVLNYWAGVAGDGPREGSPCVIVAAAAVLFMAFCGRVIQEWFRLGPRGRAVRLAFIAVVVLGAMGPTVLRTTWLVDRVEAAVVPTGMTYLAGFRDGMASRADLAGIRAWAKGHPGYSEIKDDGFVSGARRPPCIADLGPHLAQVSVDGSRTELQWPGGVLGPLRLTIGPPEMPPPRTDADCLPVAPGAYAWYEPPME